MKNILITGISGQDGTILTSKLIKDHADINILGISRYPDVQSFTKNLNIFYDTNEISNVKIVDVDFFDTMQLNNLIKNFKPDTVFNLMGPSNVNESIGNNDYYIKYIYSAFENLVKQLATLDKKIKFFQASSSEMFKESNLALNEHSALQPRNPYAVAKFKIKESIENNEFNTDNLTFLEGVMFNHDSELRTEKFLIMKIINETIKIYKNKIKNTTVGSLEYVRDWSYAGDIIDGAIKMMELDNNESFVLGSGEGTSIKKLLDITFSEFNLDWNKFVIVDNTILRKNDPIKIVSDPTKIEQKLGWTTKLTIEDIIQKFVRYKMNLGTD